MFSKHICSLMSIQKQFWLSHLLLRQRLPNGGETISLLWGFRGDPLHTHPKRQEFFSSTHQSLRKDNNRDHRILSLDTDTWLEMFVRIHCFNFDSVSTNKERLTNTFPGYHSRYHNVFGKFVFFAIQAFQLHIFLGTIEINSIVLVISWYLKGKVYLILKHEPW